MEWTGTRTLHIVQCAAIDARLGNDCTTDWPIDLRSFLPTPRHMYTFTHTNTQAAHLRLLVDGLPEGRELSVRLATAIGGTD